MPWLMQFVLMAAVLLVFVGLGYWWGYGNGYTDAYLDLTEERMDERENN